MNGAPGLPGIPPVRTAMSCLKDLNTVPQAGRTPPRERA